MVENGRFRNKAGFTAVSNIALEDKELSLRAKGLYAIIQRYITIPGFILYKSQLTSMSTEGVCAFNTVWKELKEHGYLKQYRIRTERGFSYEYELLDEPDTSSTDIINININGEVTNSTKEDTDVKESKEITDEVETAVKEDEILLSSTPPDEEQKQNVEIKTEKDYNSLKEYIENVIDYEGYKAAGVDYIDNIRDIIIEVLTCPEETIKIGKEQKNAIEVKMTFKKINYNHIDYIQSALKEKEGEITNLKSYLLTTLYNSVKTLNAFNTLNT